MRAGGAIALATALLACGCADSHFVANGKDRDRLVMLAGDPLYRTARELVETNVKVTCTASLAGYHRGTEPLDLSQVTDNQQTCYLAVVPTLPSATDVAQRLYEKLRSDAQRDGWRAQAGDSTQFTKTLGGQTASLRIFVLPDLTTVQVQMSLPHH